MSDMSEINIEIDSLTLPFSITENTWKLRLAKSQTRVKDSQQIHMVTRANEDTFVPLEVEEEGDAFTFSFFIDPEKKKWKDLEKLHRNEKLRLLCNVSKLKNYLLSRLTFFLHPDNVIFDDNLQPRLIYRGVRNVIPPFEMEEEYFCKQLKCYSIALFSKKYSFDQLMNGALAQASDTDFEKNIKKAENLEQLISYLQNSYQSEQKKTEKTMQLIPTKRFQLFKRLAIAFIIVSVVLAVPLVYFGLISLPYQHNLLDAHEEYLAANYGEVINSLIDEQAENLPKASKYILAYSYVSTEQISDSDKKIIMNNISLNSDANYLLYWIYNGRGNFESAMDKAKYLDDPVLIMHGLIQQIEQAKNDPDLSGAERDDIVNNLQDELFEYKEEYKPDVTEENQSQSETTTTPNNDVQGDTQSTE